MLISFVLISSNFIISKPQTFLFKVSLPDLAGYHTLTPPQPRRSASNTECNLCQAVMTKTDVKDQPPRRRKFGRSMIFQHDKEEEKFAKQQANLKNSKEHDTLVSRESPANELLLTNLMMKSKERAQTTSKRFPYPTAAVNTKYFSECFAEYKSPLKGTPWEDAELGRDSLRNRRRHSRQRSEEEQQCIDFLEVFG